MFNSNTTFRISCLVLLLSAGIPMIGKAQNAQYYLDQANKTFDAGKQDEAKQLYLKAAALNNAEAHYQLAYRYVLPDEEQLAHLVAAAKQGHQEALDYALSKLYFGADLMTCNPKKAYDLYLEARQKNPELALYDEANKMATLKKSLEAEPFDAEGFIKKYNLEAELAEGNKPFLVWELAEEASRGGRFGKPDPKLVLQLVSRGGWAQIERQLAVAEVYANWKAGRVAKFKICDHVTSGMAGGYCAQRAREKADKGNKVKVKQLAAKMNAAARPYLQTAIQAADKFIEEKAWNEEGHDGTGSVEWAIESIMMQKGSYIVLIEKVNNGYKPVFNTTVNYDKALNETYAAVISRLKRKPISGMRFSITHESIRDVQRLWIPHRDATAKLFYKLQPAFSESTWKNWLTKLRIEELKKIERLE